MLKLLTILLLATPVAAQMSGTYTLDLNGSGTRNFKDFTTAVFELATQGVAGPVRIDVAAGSYPGQNLVLYPVPGASSTNTITFRGPAQGTATLSLVSGQTGGLLGARSTSNHRVEHQIVENLDFVRAPASSGSTLDADHLLLRNCSLDGVELKIRGEACEIDGCHFIAPGENLYVDGSSHQVHHCFFEQTDPNPSTPPTIYFLGPSLSFGRTRVYNNVFALANGQVQLQNGVDFVHNTLLHTSTATTLNWTTLRVIPNYIGYPELSNNIVMNLGPGRLIELAGTVSPLFLRAHHNLYYQNASSNRFAANNQSYGSLAAFQTATGQEQGSIEADPLFVDTQDLPQGLRLYANSPAVGKASGTPAYVTDDFERQPRKTPGTIGALGVGQPTTFLPFGAGCAGTQGHIPAIAHVGRLKLGSTDFEVQLSKALGSITGQAFLAIGVGKIQFNFGGSCDLLVDPLILLRTSVQGSGAGNGTASFKLPIPNNPALKGKQLHFQWGVTDPVAAGIGVALSAGATLTL